MKTTVVRYQTKPEHADENQRLIKDVFAELESLGSKGFTYKVFRYDDGVTFMHVVIEHDTEDSDSLQDVPAFQAFLSGIPDRCEIQPSATGATIVGGYN